MNKTFNSRTFKFFLPYFLLALAIIIAFRVTGQMEFFFEMIGNVWNVILPFFWGFILAYIVNIPISGLQKLLVKTGNAFVIRRQRLLGVLSFLIVFAGLITLALNFIIPAIRTSVEFFQDNWEYYWASILRVVDDFNSLGLLAEPITGDTILPMLTELAQDFDLLGMLSQPLSAILGVGTAVFNGVIAFIASIYILIEKDKFKKYLSKIIKVFFPENVGIGIVQIFHGLNVNIRTYIRTQTIDGIILGTMAGIILWIMGSPFALILGIMLGIVNYIPYFGSIFGTIVAVIVVIITEGFGMGMIALLALFIVQQIDANIIQPRLMSGSFSLSPLLVIISITFGGAVAGIMGMFVAIPIVAVLKDIFESIVEYYQLRKFGEPVMAENDEGKGADEANNEEN